MTQAEIIEFLSSLDNVQREENFGYLFFFVGDDHRLPFATIADSDNEYDSVSNLSREGVFRLNIGVSRATFDFLIGAFPGENIDYTVLDVFLPHPDYAKQNFICILNPSPQNAERTQQLITEAHSIAAARLQRKTDTSDSGS